MTTNGTAPPLDWSSSRELVEALELADHLAEALCNLIRLEALIPDEVLNDKGTDAYENLHQVKRGLCEAMVLAKLAMFRAEEHAKTNVASLIMEARPVVGRGPQGR